MASPREGKYDNTPEDHQPELSAKQKAKADKAATKAAAKAAKAEGKAAAKQEGKAAGSPKDPQPIPDAGWATLNLILGIFALGMIGVWWYDAALIPIEPGNMLAGFLVLIGFCAAMQGYANRRAAKASQILARSHADQNAESFQAAHQAIDNAAAVIREEIDAVNSTHHGQQAKLTERFDAMEQWVEQHAVPLVQNPTTIVGPIVEAREKSWDSKLDAMRSDIRDVESKIPHIPNNDGLRERLDQLEANQEAWQKAQDSRMQEWLDSQAKAQPAPPAPTAQPEPTRHAMSSLDIESAIGRAVQEHLIRASWDPQRRWDNSPAASPASQAQPPQPAPAPAYAPQHPEPAPKSKPKAKPKAKPQAKPKTEAKPKAKPKAEAKPKAKPKAQKAAEKPAKARSKKAKQESPPEPEPPAKRNGKAQVSSIHKPDVRSSTKPEHPDTPEDPESVDKRINQAREMVGRRRKHSKLR